MTELIYMEIPKEYPNFDFVLFLINKQFELLQSIGINANIEIIDSVEDPALKTLHFSYQSGEIMGDIFVDYSPNDQPKASKNNSRMFFEIYIPFQRRLQEVGLLSKPYENINVNSLPYNH